MARAKLLLQKIETYTQNIGDTIRDPLIILDKDLRVKSANRSFYKTFLALPEDTEGCFIHELGNGEWNLPPLLDLLRDILPTKSHFDDYEVTHDFPKIGRRTMLLNARKLYRPRNRTVLLVLAFEDITERRIEEALVGGNFWDIFAYDDDHVAFVIGEMMGHGLMAAVFTAEFRFILRAFLREHQQPARVLEHLNSYLCESHRLFREGLNDEGDEATICLALAVLETTTGDGMAASAGMEPPLLLRVSGQVEEVIISGLLLGIQEDQHYDSAPFGLGRGETLLMTTDGITEARQGKELLGHLGLRRLIKGTKNLGTLDEAAQAILSGPRAFGGGSFRDDVCLVLARRL